MLIFGTQGALDLLGFFPEVEKLFISQILDLDVEGRFISGRKTYIANTLAADGPESFPDFIVLTT